MTTNVIKVLGLLMILPTAAMSLGQEVAAPVEVEAPVVAATPEATPPQVTPTSPTAPPAATAPIGDAAAPESDRGKGRNGRKYSPRLEKALRDRGTLAPENYVVPSLSPSSSGSSPSSPSPAEGLGVTKSKGGKLNLDYVNAEISDMAKSMSELTKRNFILDDRVRGKITIISPNSVTPEEAYQAFISALEVKGFTIVPAGKMLKIVQLQSMKNSPVPLDVEFPSGGDDAFVTRLIPLKYNSAAEISKTLRNLITRNGDLMSYDPTNTLIITDAAGNIRKLLKIIEKIDQPGFQQSMEVIRLKYASAQDTAEKIMTILDLKDKRPGGTPGQPQPNPAEMGSSSQFISKIIPDDRINSLIVLANEEGIKQIKALVDKIDRALEDEAEKGSIHVHYLQYADAAELSATLASLSGTSTGGAANAASGQRGGSTRPRRNQNLFSMPPGQAPAQQQGQGASGPVSGTLSGIGTLEGDVRITADAPTNSLVITASPHDYKALTSVIRKLDIRRPQAFVEAMILEVDINRLLQTGIAGHGGQAFGTGGNSTVFGGTGLGPFNTIGAAQDPTSITGLAQGLFGGVLGRTIDLSLGSSSTLSIPTYGAIFQALQTNGTINILSTPNILTTDNTEAEIVVGQVVPFVSFQGRDSNQNPVNQISRENVALTLRVTPQINDSDDVTLMLNQEVQDLVPSQDVSLGPTTSTRSAKTTVVVKDHQTVTIGGLISDRQTESVSKVPILGDIPLLGWLFKSKRRDKQKTSLMIFITPHIIRQPEDLEDISLKKNDQRRKFMEENALSDHPGVQRYGLDKKLRVPPSKPKAEKPPVPADSPTGSFLPSPVTEPALALPVSTPPPATETLEPVPAAPAPEVIVPPEPKTEVETIQAPSVDTQPPQEAEKGID